MGARDDVYRGGAAAMIYAALTGTPTQVLPQDERRRALLISAPAAGVISLWWDATPGSNPGILLTAGQAPLFLTRDWAGGLCTYPLLAAGSGGATTVVIAVEQWT